LIGALGLSTADGDNDGNNGTLPGENKKELSEAEVMELWKSQIERVSTKIELKGLYLKNKKVVDSNEKIKDIFKEKEEELNSNRPNNNKITMP
jgi:hypothetical protein